MERGARLAIALVLGLTGGAAWPAAPAAADVIVPDPPKTKRVTVELKLDWGVLADRVSRPYDVAEGDTLGSIAARHCGDKARWKEIADANPGAVQGTDGIRAGTRLWLPPVRAFDPPPPATAPADASALGRWYDAFSTERFQRLRLAVGSRTGPTDAPAAPVSSTLLLMPHADTPALLAALRDPDRRVTLDHPAAAKGVRLTMGVSNLAHADDPTTRIVVTYRITGIDGRSVTTEATSVRYDAKGKVVAKALPLEGERDAPPKPSAPAPRDDAKDGLLRLSDVPPPDSGDGDGFRWPEATGIVVALAGAAVAAAVVLLRRRKSSAS